MDGRVGPSSANLGTCLANIGPFNPRFSHVQSAGWTGGGAEDKTRCSRFTRRAHRASTVPSVSPACHVARRNSASTAPGSNSRMNLEYIRRLEAVAASGICPLMLEFFLAAPSSFPWCMCKSVLFLSWESSAVRAVSVPSLPGPHCVSRSHDSRQVGHRIGNLGRPPPRHKA